MDAIHSDCWKGDLSQEKLVNYLSSPGFNINSSGGPQRVTPLAAACWKGHLDVVDLLLKNPEQRADPNAPSDDHNRTPLYYATTRCPPKSRGAIVRALLEARVHVNDCSGDDDRNTPLMNAILEVRDKDVVRQLVDAGASLSLANSRGETARDLARGTTMESILRGSIGSALAHALGINVLMSLVLFILVCAKRVKTFALQQVNGFVAALHPVKNCQDDQAEVVTVEPGTPIENATSGDEIVDKPVVQSEDKAPLTLKPGPNTAPEEQPDSHNVETIINQDIQNAIGAVETIEKLQEGIDSYVRDTGLEKFFAPGDTFLADLAEKANALRADPDETLNTPESISRLTRLALYQPIIYCDDSGSMRIDNRFHAQSELVQRIARIATKLVPDDCVVELRFINNTSPFTLAATQIHEVEAVMEKVRPSGGTKLGTNLRHRILQPLVFDVLDKGEKLQRPFLICIITDGRPDREPFHIRQVIIDCKKRLDKAGYSPTSVMFMLSQIGNDKKAAAFLKELGDDNELVDVLQCTSDQLDSGLGEFKENERRLDEWLLKTLTAPIMSQDEV